MTASNGSNERPGGWIEGIGWVAMSHDLADGTTFHQYPDDRPEHEMMKAWRTWLNRPVIVTRWSDGTVPSPPSPVEDGRPDTAALDELRKLSATSSTGTWRASGDLLLHCPYGDDAIPICIARPTFRNDTAFIAAAVNYVRSLLAAHPSPGTGDDGSGT